MRSQCCLMAIVLSAPVFADTTLEFTTGEGETARMEIHNGKLRTSAPGEDSYMLFDATRREMTMVNPAERNFTTIGRAEMEKVVAMQRQAMAQLDAQLAQMPPAQAEQMKKMMGSMISQMSGQAKPRRYERGGKDSVAGFECTRLTIHSGSEPVTELCVAEADALGIPDADFETFSAMQDFLRTLMESVPMVAEHMMEFGEPGREEFAVRFAMLGPMGVKVDGELRSVDTSAIDPARFDVPQGYQRQRMPDPSSLGR